MKTLKISDEAGNSLKEKANDANVTQKALIESLILDDKESQDVVELLHGLYKGLNISLPTQEVEQVWEAPKGVVMLSNTDGSPCDWCVFEDQLCIITLNEVYKVWDQEALLSPIYFLAENDLLTPTSVRAIYKLCMSSEQAKLQRYADNRGFKI